MTTCLRRYRGCGGGGDRQSLVVGEVVGGITTVQNTRKPTTLLVVAVRCSIHSSRRRVVKIYTRVRVCVCVCFKCKKRDNRFAETVGLLLRSSRGRARDRIYVRVYIIMCNIQYLIRPDVVRPSASPC